METPWRPHGEVMETLTGSAPSASTVSRVFHTLEGAYAAWKGRPLSPRYEYLFADGTYFTVIDGTYFTVIHLLHSYI